MEKDNRPKYLEVEIVQWIEETRQRLKNVHRNRFCYRWLVKEINRSNAWVHQFVSGEIRRPQLSTIRAINDYIDTWAEKNKENVGPPLVEPKKEVDNDGKKDTDN